MTEEADNQQGFADLRAGRYRRITPEVLQQEQDAASSETAWRNVLADYRYLRATLNALVQPDRQLSVEELVDSALNHDTMHSDTAMVILMQLAAKGAAMSPEEQPKCGRYHVFPQQTVADLEFWQLPREPVQILCLCGKLMYLAGVPELSPAAR